MPKGDDRTQAIVAVVVAAGVLTAALGTLLTVLALTSTTAAGVIAKLTLPAPYTMADMTKSSKARELGLDNTPDEDSFARGVYHANTVLLPLARLLGIKRVPLNSWHREPPVNKAVGGSKNSNHMEGGATDVKHNQLGYTSRELFEIIRDSDIPFHTLIAYHPDTVGSLHVDSEPGSNRRKLLYRHADGKYRDYPYWS